MNKAEATEYGYIDFLIGARKVYSCAEAERVHPDETDGPSHDACTRRLRRLFPTAARPRAEAEQHADPAGGRPTADDGAPDKPCGRKIGPVARHRSGGHRRAVSGIGLPTPLRTDGERHIPADFRSYSKSADGPTGNGHNGDSPRKSSCSAAGIPVLKISNVFDLSAGDGRPG